jgi:hypothetical protein
MNLQRIDNLPPALLLRRLARYPNPAVYGFPLNTDLIISSFESAKHPNLTEDTRGELLQTHVVEVLSHLEGECRAVWHSNAINHESLSLDADDEYKIILVIVKCTRPDNKFIPPPEKLKELKNIMAREGFTEEPGWFVLNE